jgi:hypothetical protein
MPLPKLEHVPEKVREKNFHFKNACVKIVIMNLEKNGLQAGQESPTNRKI